MDKGSKNKVLNPLPIPLQLNLRALFSLSTENQQASWQPNLRSLQVLARHEATQEDEGDRSLGTGLQEQAPNHLKLLWSKTRVVSVKEKIWQRAMSGEVQGDERRGTTAEVWKTSNGDVRTGRLTLLQDSPGGNLFTAWTASGIEVAWSAINSINEKQG